MNIKHTSAAVHLTKNIWGAQCQLISGGGGACGVMVIVVGNGSGHTNSNPGRDWLHFT